MDGPFTLTGFSGFSLENESVKLCYNCVYHHRYIANTDMFLLSNNGISPLKCHTSNNTLQILIFLGVGVVIMQYIFQIIEDHC